MQHDLTRLATLVRAALPHLVVFAPGLDALQEEACQALGPSALHLLGLAMADHLGSDDQGTAHESASRLGACGSAPVGRL